MLRRFHKNCRDLKSRGMCLLRGGQGPSDCCAEKTPWIKHSWHGRVGDPLWESHGTTYGGSGSIPCFGATSYKGGKTLTDPRHCDDEISPTKKGNKNQSSITRAAINRPRNIEIARQSNSNWRQPLDWDSCASDKKNTRIDNEARGQLSHYSSLLLFEVHPQKV